MLAALTLPAAAGDVPGTIPLRQVGRTTDGPMDVNALTAFTTERGRIFLSLDAAGSNNASHIIQVQKPAGATVRKAFMMSATIYGGGQLTNTSVQINGQNVVWNLVANLANSINSFNCLGDVTSIVKPIVDAAPAGLVNLTMTETNTALNDGEILAVIFDDPNQLVDNTVILLFGAQTTTGDNFAIRTSEPINTNDPNVQLGFSLGISYSYQAGGSQQFSQVSVNGTRLTSAAGGEDDGASSNGALITVGGIGDTTLNPTNPNAPPTNPRSDDELYNIKPFVPNGSTTITVTTLNPSNDDNVMFAALSLTGVTAVVGEGVTLSPLLDTNFVGQSHTVTATVQNTNGQPISGRTVNFRVKSGPHVGTSGAGTTNASGQATFTYTGTSVGTDILIARMTNSTGSPDSSNEVRKVWRTQEGPEQTPPECVLTSIIPGPPRQILITLRDQQSGLQSVEVITNTNATVVVPTFTPGSTAPLVVTATKINQELTSVVALRVRDVAGNTTVCDPVYTTLSTGTPDAFTLGANYPNPFNPTTRIEFSLPKEFAGGVVTLKVYDMLGREVRTLISEPMQSGVFQAEWNATDNAGVRVPSGVYIYRLTAGKYSATKKMTLLQ
jgi:hypothetical protein